jgi:hypothetical protein
VRECTKNYSLELSNIPLEYLKLIISNIIRQNNVDWNTKTCFKFKLWFSQNNKITKQIQKTKFQNLLKKKWNIFLKDSPFKVEDGFFKIEDNLTVPELDLKNLAKTKYGSTRQNNKLVKSAHCLNNPGCIVDQNNRTLIHLENIDDQNALLHATEAVNKYYFHLIKDEIHRSPDFCKNRVEHFGAFKLYKKLPYTSANMASSHYLAHQPCVNELILSLVPLSTYVNKFVQNNYGNMYLKLKNLFWGPFAPKPFGIFPMIAINFNQLSNYHWDKLDAPNCLCCLIPLGDFQGGELYFPQLHTVVPLRPGQIVAFSSHYLLHGNFHLTDEANNIRHSIVYFIHKNFFHKKDNFENMEIDNAESKNLRLKLYNNYDLNSIKPVFKSAQAFQTREYTNNNNKNDQRRDSW